MSEKRESRSTNHPFYMKNHDGCWGGPKYPLLGDTHPLNIEGCNIQRGCDMGPSDYHNNGFGGSSTKSTTSGVFKTRDLSEEYSEVVDSIINALPNEIDGMKLVLNRQSIAWVEPPKKIEFDAGGILTNAVNALAWCCKRGLIK